MALSSHLSKEGGELRANGGKIIECVQVLNDEGCARLSALELPVSLTEFMCHSAGDGIRVYVRQEN